MPPLMARDDVPPVPIKHGRVCAGVCARNPLTRGRFDPDDDVFYWDEAVRWTVDELSKLDLTGKPIRMMHADEDELPAVGSILHNFMDNSGHLHIVAEISGDDKYGQAAISLVDNGTCHELSIGYPLDRDPVTKVVYHSDVDEVRNAPPPPFLLNAHAAAGQFGRQGALSRVPSECQGKQEQWSSKIHLGSVHNLQSGASISKR